MAEVQKQTIQTRGQAIIIIRMSMKWSAGNQHYSDAWTLQEGMKLLIKIILILSDAMLTKFSNCS